MLNVRKLSTEEVDQMLATNAKKASKSREVTRQLYDSFVADYNAGEFGEVALEDGESKLTVKKHLTNAFVRRGLKAEWQRSKRNQSGVVRFKVTE